MVVQKCYLFSLLDLGHKPATKTHEVAVRRLFEMKNTIFGRRTEPHFGRRTFLRNTSVLVSQKALRKLLKF